MRLRYQKSIRKEKLLYVMVLYTCIKAPLMVFESVNSKESCVECKKKERQQHKDFPPQPHFTALEKKIHIKFIHSASLFLWMKMFLLLVLYAYNCQGKNLATPHRNSFMKRSWLLCVCVSVLAVESVELKVNEGILLRVT